MPFPSVLSTFNRPTPTDRLNSPSHSALHNTVSSAVGQLEAVIGTNTGANASAVGTLMYDVRSPASGGGGHVQAANAGGTGQTSYTKGDLLVASSSSVLTKLAIGSDGQLLGADSTTATGVKWGTAINPKSYIPDPVYKIPTGAGQIVSSLYSGAALFTLFNLPQTMTVTEISLQAGVHTTNGTVRVGVYNETGQTKEIDVISPTITTTNALYPVVVSSVQLTAGNHYLAILGMSSVETRFFAFTGDAQDIILNKASTSIVGARPFVGVSIVGTSGTPLPATFTPSNLSVSSIMQTRFRIN